MKASLKFREEQKPIFRAKVPINVLGFPFQSGIVAGESKEVSLNLTTFFNSGPCFKFAYRPNDSINPFSFIFKTGIGAFGSPISSPINMSAEFNFTGGQNPSFFINFKPKFGDFSLKKSQTSVFRDVLMKGGRRDSDDDGPVIVNTPSLVSVISRNGGSNKFTVLETPAAGVVKGVCEDIEVTATTAVPVRKQVKLNFRWGIRFPADMGTAAWKGNSFEKLPMLVMNKIGIEHVPVDDSKEVGPSLKRDDVAGACLDVSKQLEVIQAENGMLRKAMEELRLDFLGVSSSGGGGWMDKKSIESNGFGGKVMEGEEK